MRGGYRDEIEISDRVFLELGGMEFNFIYRSAADAGD